MSDLWIVLNIVLLRYIFLLQTVALLLKVVFDIDISDLAKISHFIKSLVSVIFLKLLFVGDFVPNGSGLGLGHWVKIPIFIGPDLWGPSVSN